MNGSTYFKNLEYVFVQCTQLINFSQYLIPVYFGTPTPTISIPVLITDTTGVDPLTTVGKIEFVNNFIFV